VASDHTWQSFAVEYDLTGTTSGGVVKVFNDGTLVSADYLVNGERAALANDWLCFGSRAATAKEDAPGSFTKSFHTWRSESISVQSGGGVEPSCELA
jgi:hypothetical protein